MASRYDCADCGKTPHEAAIHRTSPKGQPFAGKCSACLAGRPKQHSFGDRLADALAPIDPSAAQVGDSSEHIFGFMPSTCYVNCICGWRTECVGTREEAHAAWLMHTRSNRSYADPNETPANAERRDT